ncbi:glycoside hydrolase family 99-like domain-containing protein [Xylanibacter ruminicola]|uniref:Glycosyltransferase WbsX n=1 Tax=Xylanibacter ruminicola TaxID=839 RepID=A0A1M6VY65_XYLRU|nr:glycoside hydrolase family 99-like domain-containing protein [Xylanibacter ruminicola]SHK86413.1 Glycosyltransferase WbsX [Xylanibacter ruminicola]
MKPRIIGLYLPQYHPIPENDEWWGKGFTEWNNVVKAKPLFRGHYQPHLPADLGFYDLRLPEVREQQAELAREAGLEGFCYYHYWFGNGKQLLQRPFEEVLASGKPDFPFCLCWANHDWTSKTWEKGSSLRRDTMIMKMEYSREDYVRHFNYLLPAFRNPRYIKVDGKPLFAVWAPRNIPDGKEFIDLWQKMAQENGLKGIHFVGQTDNTGKALSGKKANYYSADMAKDYYKSVLDLGFDAVMSQGYRRAVALAQGRAKMTLKLLSFNSFMPTYSKIDYGRLMENYYVEEDRWENVYPTLLPQWDRTPRAGSKTEIVTSSSPDKFQHYTEQAIQIIANKQPEHQILFLKSWNEWGEGNYVEPDQKFGHGWLQAIRNAMMKYK